MPRSNNIKKSVILSKCIKCIKPRCYLNITYIIGINTGRMASARNVVNNLKPIKNGLTHSWGIHIGSADVSVSQSSFDPVDLN